MWLDGLEGPKDRRTEWTEWTASGELKDKGSQLAR